MGPFHPSKEYHLTNLGERVVKALQKNRIPAELLGSVEEARERLLKEIPPNATVGIGGSVTIRQLGVIEALEKRGNRVIHHWKEEMGHDAEGNRLPNWSKGIDLQVRREALTSDVYLCSANAVTLDGKIENADGNANRTAAMTFGPGRVIIVAGLNKVVEDMEAGIARIRHIAAPMSTHRGRANTPCAKTGICPDCDSPERGCSVLTIIEKKPKLTDMLFLLVREELGF